VLSPKLATKQRLTCFCLCDRTTSSLAKAPNLQGVCVLVLGHEIGPPTLSRRLIRQHKCLFAGISKDGSDGTRTRDLRRDRPTRPRRRSATDVSEQAYLQVLFAVQRRPLRMVEPIVQSTFGPRVGHGNSSSWTTPRRREGHDRRCVLRGEATVFRSVRFARGCHRSRPLGSINAPSRQSAQP
jgi:hypothetical protein